MAWLKMDPGRLLVEIDEAASPEAFMQRMKRLAKALILKQKGVDEWADEMAAEGAEYVSQQTIAGRASGEARRKSRTRSEQNANATRTETNGTRTETNDGERVPNATRTDSERNANGNERVPNGTRTETNGTRTDGERKTNGTPRARAYTDQPTNRPTDIQHRQTDPTARADARPRVDGPSGSEVGSESVVGDVPSQVGVGSESAEPPDAPPQVQPVPPVPDDPYGELGATPDERLPEMAVGFCREGDPKRALAEYRKAMDEMEPWRFRILLDQFIGDCRRDEPGSRGKVFMSRIMKTLTLIRDQRRQDHALGAPK